MVLPFDLPDLPLVFAGVISNVVFPRPVLASAIAYTCRFWFRCIGGRVWFSLPLALLVFVCGVLALAFVLVPFDVRPGFDPGELTCLTLRQKGF